MTRTPLPWAVALALVGCSAAVSDTGDTETADEPATSEHPTDGGFNEPTSTSEDTGAHTSRPPDDDDGDDDDGDGDDGVVDDGDAEASSHFTSLGDTGIGSGDTGPFTDSGDLRRCSDLIDAQECSSTPTKDGPCAWLPSYGFESAASCTFDEVDHVCVAIEEQASPCDPSGSCGDGVANPSYYAGEEIDGMARIVDVRGIGGCHVPRFLEPCVAGSPYDACACACLAKL